jgi:bifunctional DNA-binding transcriptional regulator/antitoxin component of YhaV-PrlF toxin-antitoxin module
MKVKVKAKEKTAVAVKTRKGRTTTTRLSAKNQITLPVDIIRKAGFKVGDTINCTVTKEGRIELSPPENPIVTLIGAGNGIFDDFDLEAERAYSWGE